MPPPAPAIALPRVRLKSDAAAGDDACGKCKFWAPHTAQRPPAQPNQPEPAPVAHCRRYPPQLLIMNMAMGGNPKVIDPRTGIPQHAQIIPQPIPFQTATAATDWCGEYTVRPAPPAAS